MAIRIQLRKDHPDVWDSADPTLAAGEFGFAWDSADSASFGRLKIGDGSTSWTNLPYFYSAGDSAGNYASAGGGGAVWYGDRAMVGGGGTASQSRANSMEYWDMTTAGNASDFGDLNVGATSTVSASDASRGIFGMGYDGSVRQNFLDYIAIATTGNGTDFGDTTVGRNGGGGVTNGIYGVFAGGFSGVFENTIDYVTIQTTGNANDFGDLISTPYNVGSISNTTYGLFPGGNNLQSIDYITIATPGNASDFGDLLEVTDELTTCGADDTRGIIAGGETTTLTYSNVIQYVTIATPSNSTDFGDLIAGLRKVSCASNGTYVHMAGGGSSQKTNTIQQITVQTTGNASDFGDLTETRSDSSALSGSPS